MQFGNMFFLTMWNYEWDNVAAAESDREHQQNSSCENPNVLQTWKDTQQQFENKISGG